MTSQVSYMRVSFSECNQAQPMVSFPQQYRKDTVVVVLGATGTGKSRLAIDLASRFPAEIVNSDKMQVYKGLDIVTNKVTEEERLGVPHHLLGFVDPNADFTTLDFRRHASAAVESIVRRNRLPIIVGGSNSYIKALVNDDVEFQSKYECCLLWVDVSLPVLYTVVSERVDEMVEAGLVDEVREMFDPKADYGHGIRRAIGVSEMDRLLRSGSKSDGETKAVLLGEAIEKIKSNTCKLASRQLQNIQRLQNQFEWKMHRLDATVAFAKRGGDGDAAAWEKFVLEPSTIILDKFLYTNGFRPATIGTPTFDSTTATSFIIGATPMVAATVAGTTH
ncbi:hypothetical protein RHMOL_Rhmol02G0021300 [Rhododendron molle]|uniref:Uncharacterized protein n=1 Tax=Rhododendron molle TaxID=49168 RepID=A0ACC0PM87_RHOML|nr:hypothetical protein RHMOL_Rhmol02G0021300 [Rhododendron molle]